jgi:hypothetical protein
MVLAREMKYGAETMGSPDGMWHSLLARQYIRESDCWFRRISCHSGCARCDGGGFEARVVGAQLHSSLIKIEMFTCMPNGN